MNVRILDAEPNGRLDGRNITLEVEQDGLTYPVTARSFGVLIAEAAYGDGRGELPTDVHAAVATTVNAYVRDPAAHPGPGTRKLTADQIVDALKAHGIHAIADPDLERVLTTCPYCVAADWLPVEIGAHGGLRAICHAKNSVQHDARVAEHLGQLIHGGRRG